MELDGDDVTSLLEKRCLERERAAIGVVRSVSGGEGVERGRAGGHQVAACLGAVDVDDETVVAGEVEGEDIA